MKTLYSNPNAKRRRVFTENVRRLPGNLATQADVDEAAADRQGSQYEANKAQRKERTNMVDAALAARLIVHSGDKRRRPPGVSREAFVLARKLKLTRTAPVRKKK